MIITMELIMTILAVYLVGGILSYGRAYAACPSRNFALINFAFSWMGFVIGLIYYFTGDYGILHKPRFLRFK